MHPVVRASVRDILRINPLIDSVLSLSYRTDHRRQRKEGLKLIQSEARLTRTEEEISKIIGVENLRCRVSARRRGGRRLDLQPRWWHSGSHGSGKKETKRGMETGQAAHRYTEK